MSQEHPSAARSRRDLAQLAAVALANSGWVGVGGFHLVRWEHDATCLLNPEANPHHELANECVCELDGTLVLDVGTPAEREIPIMRDGIALPPRSSAGPAH
jgi:hypothetical protein